jgi:hypothetical protein
MTETRDPFLARWSRRKQAKLDESDAGGDAQAVAGSDGEVIGQESGENPATAEIVEQLPDIESLDENSDFTAFLKEGVPDALRRGALRRLWRLNPVFANLDGLADYDEDFTTPWPVRSRPFTRSARACPARPNPSPSRKRQRTPRSPRMGPGSRRRAWRTAPNSPNRRSAPKTPSRPGLKQ